MQFDMQDELEYWYRYEETGRSPSDGIYSTVEVRLREYRVLKHTPKGVWLDGPYFRPRFVRLDANKRFACPTLEEAKVSFLARKSRQLSIYEARVRIAKEAIKLMEADTVGRTFYETFGYSYRFFKDDNEKSSTCVLA